jgi:hypothetical protein
MPLPTYFNNFSYILFEMFFSYFYGHECEKKATMEESGEQCYVVFAYCYGIGWGGGGVRVEKSLPPHTCTH